MNEVLVIVLTSIPVCAGGVLGYRLGLLRLVRAGTPIVGAWGLGWYFASTGLSQAWFRPFGLSTPIVIGALASVAGWLVLRRLVAVLALKSTGPEGRRPATPRHGPLNGFCGATLGGACGLLIAASAWLLLFLLEGLMAPPETMQAAAIHAQARKTTWARSLLRTANRGFVRHLPVIGSLGDEVEAVVILLNSDRRACEKLASRHDLARLVELPSFRAIAEDPHVLEELESVRNGDLSALYRLQKNPLILRFFKEKEVQKAIAGLSASSLARELEAIEAAEEIR